MNQLQLRVSVARATMMADAIKFQLAEDPWAEGNKELASIETWLRYRVARAARPTPTDPTQ